MKKRITVCAALFVFTVLSAMGDEYYYGLGRAMAVYRGTTKDFTIEELYNIAIRNITNNSSFSTPQPLNGKLSKRQSSLLWKALAQYDYAAGEIYSVTFNEEGEPRHEFCLIVQIEADGSCTWMGFTCDF